MNTGNNVTYVVQYPSWKTWGQLWIKTCVSHVRHEQFHATTIKTSMHFSTLSISDHDRMDIRRFCDTAYIPVCLPRERSRNSAGLVDRPREFLRSSLRLQGARSSALDRRSTSIVSIASSARERGREKKRDNASQFGGETETGKISYSVCRRSTHTKPPANYRARTMRAKVPVHES